MAEKSQARLSQYLFVCRALRQSVRELRADGCSVSAPWPVSREAEPIPRFREILLQRGTRPSLDKIAVITMRGLISSSIPGNVTDSMVDDMRAALQQARDDSRVKAIVLRDRFSRRRSDCVGCDLQRGGQERARRNQSSFIWIRWRRPAAIMSPVAANF